jgi:hypothetical protein
MMEIRRYNSHPIEHEDDLMFRLRIVNHSDDYEPTR